MTDLERAILHIKTRADAWAVKEVEKALSQEPTEKPMCDRNICLNNEYNGIGCDECVVNKVKQEPCDDAISREELLKAIDTWDKFGCDADTKLVRYQDHYIPYIHYDDVIKCIKGMPSVTHKSGKWIAQDIHNCHTDFKCSECGYIHSFMHLYGKPTADYTYCPNCGAKMESEDKE